MRNPGGFTLIELLFAVAIGGVFLGAAFPLGQAYLRRGELESAARKVSTTARYAQEKAMAGSFDASWGVRVDPGAIILFQGDTYATRTVSFDQTEAIPASLVPSGTTEFGFARLTGRTTAGTLTITDAEGLSRTVTINEFGTVDY